jgi:hypothetical protein
LALREERAKVRGIRRVRKVNERVRKGTRGKANRISFLFVNKLLQLLVRNKILTLLFYIFIRSSISIGKICFISSPVAKYTLPRVIRDLYVGSIVNQ